MRSEAPSSRRFVLLLLVSIGMLVLAPAGSAQTAPVRVGGEVFVNSEAEDYLRLLQVTGRIPLYPWSVRGFSLREVESLAPAAEDHPWSDRYDYRFPRGGAPTFQVVRPEARLIFNSGFPYGHNDGPIWAGRGLTTAISMGAAASIGPLSLTLAPIYFRAENREFDLFQFYPSRAGKAAYFDPLSPQHIDLPQRFGDDSYARLDPGQSTIRLDIPYLTAGVSTANQHWGPAREFPILLGNNAPGYLHVFLGTPSPVNVWLGELHGRFIWGSLTQSEFSPLPDGMTDRRFTSALALTFTPRGLPGLEVGGARIFHETWPEDGINGSDLIRPVESVLKKYLPEKGFFDGNEDHRKSSPDNQLLSVFARLVLPGSGFEIYGEYGREDANFDFRDFVLALDQHASYGLGFRKVWSGGEDRMVSVRGELVNGQISHLIRVRTQVHHYRHSWVVQGHTQHGQILGSPAVRGGQGSILGIDLHRPWGRLSGDWTRIIRMEWGGYWEGNESFPDLGGIDLMNGLGIGGVAFVGPVDLTANLRGVWNLNRNLWDDVFNTNLGLGMRIAF